MTARKRAESRWFGKPPSFEDMADLSANEQRKQLRRMADEVERIALSSPRPSRRALARLAKLKAQLSDASGGNKL